MTLNKRHMAGSVLMLVGAVSYNVWVFTRPATRSASAAAPVGIAGASAPDGGAGERNAVMNLAQVPVLPDVAIDRLPSFPRDPFEDLREQPQIVEATMVAPVQVESDPVVASILYSSGRRLAVIDGRIVRPHDRVGSAIVVDILPKAVVLEFPDGDRRTVDLQGPRTTPNVQRPTKARPPTELSAGNSTAAVGSLRKGGQ